MLTVSIGKDLVDVADKLGVIQAVKQKLVAQPDPALDKLVTALEEVSKIYDVLQSEVKSILSLYFDPSATPDAAKSRAQERATLVSLEGGELAARMRKAKGHSSKIQNIYGSTYHHGFRGFSHRTRIMQCFNSFIFFTESM